VIAFGVNIRSLHSDTPFSKAFDGALHQTEKRSSNPFWKLVPDPEIYKSIGVLDNYVLTMIEERRKDPLLNEREDLLSSYIRNTQESDKALRDVVVNFLIAGRDTTGQSLTWLFYLLSQNPEVESKLIEEIDSLNGSIPGYENLKNQLPYLDGVVNETLRLYPPVPVDPKYALEDDMMPNNVFIPKGSTVVWSAWIMGRSEKYWKDPLKMDPNRWLDKNPGGHSFVHIPFQAGPRICLGMAMALLEVKLCTVLILQKFRLKLVPNQTVEPMYNITLNTAHGCKMFVEPRK